MRFHQPDYTLIFAVLALVILGLAILSSASVVISQENFNESYHYLKHQLFYGLPLGLLCFLVFQRINYHYWQKLAFLLLLIGIIFLGLALIPKMGYSYNQSKRWLNLGGVSLQPFEFVKLTFIVYLAAILGRKQNDDGRSIKESVLPFSAVFGIICLLVILQPNISALIILCLISGVIYFLAGLKLRYVPFILAIAAIGIFFLIKIAPYRADRLNVFLHPEIDPQGKGYQINQALLAIGSGGLWGKGLGRSVQKWKYLPEVIGDSVFAVAAEELGFIGVTVVVSLFVFLAWRGLAIAKNAADRFGFLVAGGITGWLFGQAIVNIAAISGLIPLTGLPLPFISYGGSALVASLAGMGILVNISKYT